MRLFMLWFILELLKTNGLFLRDENILLVNSKDTFLMTWDIWFGCPVLDEPRLGVNPSTLQKSQFEVCSGYLL